jgi:hypothetical protein
MTLRQSGVGLACFQDGGAVGRIPQGRLYGIGLNVLKYWPLPNDNAGYAATSSYNYQSIKPTVESRGRQEAVRVDYQFSPKLRASGKLITQDNSTEPKQRQHPLRHRDDGADCRLQ